MNEQEYFDEQSRKRLADLGIEPGPRQPLDELHAENERLRGMLAYVARCLKGSDFAVAPDREYAASLAEYIEKRIPATELTDEFVSGQIMDRLYDEV